MMIKIISILCPITIAAEYAMICSKLLRVGVDDELGTRRRPKVMIEVTERRGDGGIE
jgi:hypothetical protein